MTPATRLLFPVTAILSVLFASPVFAQNAGAPVVAFNTPAEGEVFASGSDVTVNGGQILGDVPPAAFNHEFDSGRGRLIPQISVDQYAGALGRWFGLSNSEIIDALPGFGNCDGNALDGLFA